MRELPPGWSWQILSDVLINQSNKKQLQQGWSPRCETHPAAEGEWGVLKTTAIQPGFFDMTQNKQLPTHLQPRPALEVITGDLLITCAGPRSRCGIPTLVRRTRGRLMMSGKMYRLRPNDSVDPRFLEAWLLTDEAQSLIDGMKTGISDSGLNLTHDRFLALPVPVPPRPEQELIVEALEEHLSRLEFGEAQLARTLDRADAWIAGVEDSALWKPGLPNRPIASLLREPMRNGRSDVAPADGKPGIRAVTITAVTRNAFVDEHTKLTSTSPGVAEKLWLAAGDIFVQRSNTPQLVGSTSRYAGPARWAIFPDLLIRLRVDESVIDSRYLTAVMRSERLHRELRAKAKGLSSSMPKIDQDAIGTTSVPVPSIVEQLHTIAALDDTTATYSRIRGAVESARRRASSLRSSLFIAAFRGQLTKSYREERVFV